MKIVKYKIEAPLSERCVIALLSDLHGKFNPRIIPALKEEKPSIICIVGDLINTSVENSPMVLGFLEKCIDIAPTFLSLGNHDCNISQENLKMLSQLGVVVLNDRFVRYNEEIVIGGLTSYFYHKCERYDPKIPMALYPELSWLEEFEKQASYKILMDHHPDNYPKYTSNRNIDLILSGHEHGGQIRIFGRGVYGRSQGFFPRYDGGVFDKKLVVSRGLSNTMPIPRLWNPTELVFIELKKRNG